ncbi:ribonuclease P protein component [Amycolatopsis coloradensis]|uniref:Ribonuclease P protein component n=1 Tax=Amycolatopsis coloradensis TaxID=76021 RepID=A0A1R0KL07_9PSEU|nr:ribonuclease P protein component [Amycolatopsis coloradensis]OLZ47355.1 ribonuclease P protein component [Amycolatopsis coloradensis]
MLPAAARLRRSEDFRAVMRRGAKAGRRRLVVHALTTDPPDAAEAARAGFVVSKAVGNSVVRHRVTRRLRHLISARIGTLPSGSSLVIRALPPAADASSAELGSDLDASLRRLGLSGPSVSSAVTGKSRQTRPPDNGSAV